MSMNRSRPAWRKPPHPHRSSGQSLAIAIGRRLRIGPHTDTWRNDVGKTTSSEKAFDDTEGLWPEKECANGRTRKPVPKPSRLATATALLRGAAEGAAAAVARRLPWAKDQHDPIVLLETDHRRFEKLFEQGKATTERGAKRRSQLLNTLTAALNVHEAIEEKFLYPALKPHAEAHESCSRATRSTMLPT